MKKIMWIISCISLAGTALVLQFMPDTVPVHYDIAGNVNRYGSKYENLLFPGIILLTTLFLSLMSSYFSKKAEKVKNEKEIAEAKTNEKVLNIVGVTLAAFFTTMQGVIIYNSWKGADIQSGSMPVDLGKVCTILLGVTFVILGNFMTKTRTNSVLGLRTTWSMYNDNTWRKSNRFGAIAIIAAGILTIISAIFIKNSFGATMASLGYLIIASIAAVIYSYKVYKKEVSA